MIKLLWYRLCWSLTYDYIFLYRIPGLKIKERILFIVTKYFFYVKDTIFGLPAIPTPVKVFDRLFYYNDIFGLTSLQRVYCEHYRLKKWVRNNPVVIDAGAHIGQFNFFSSHYLHARRIISIEPSADCFDLLKLNALHAGDCFNEAINADAGIVTIHVSKASTQMNSYVKSSRDEYCRQFTSPAETLDDLTERLAIENIDLLKIDTEGSEYDILRSASSTLNKVHLAVVEMCILRESTGSIFKTGALLERERFVLRELDCFHSLNPPMANGVFEKILQE